MLVRYLLADPLSIQEIRCISSKFLEANSLIHIGGNYASTINFEANLPNLLPDSSNADISLFVDTGTIWGVDYNSSIDGDSPKLRASTGVNANWFSPIGPVTFTLSQNITKASTDETQRFRFQLGTSF